MIKRLFLVLIVLSAAYPAIAQNFKGIITNARQRPLKGIKVWKKNTTESAKTDKTGVFVFSQIYPGDTLVIGVSKREEAIIAVQGLNQIVVKLEKKHYILQDGTNEYKREYKRTFRANTSSNVLTREQIAKLSANSIYDILKGSISGVTVTEGADGRQVSIRGGNSFDLNTEPLFVVDGTLYESSAEVDSYVSVNDIERIEVQKDGAAYGMKGANGVIIITTMKR